ncbi:MAG: hypothetical protein GQ537_00060 [Gammaproteobacteria bacterium]|nr:hypothetical protein [Gammaproteobacteria bacterium]
MKQVRRQLTRRVAMVCGISLTGLLVSWLAVLGLGISIPLDGFRYPVEAAVSRALGRDVYINGALGLRPTLGPTIVVHDVRIPDPAGEGELLRAGRVAVRLALFSLLRGEQHAVRMVIEDVSIDLDTQGILADSASPAEADYADSMAYTAALPTSAELLAQQPEFQELVLHRVTLNYRDGSTGQTYPLKLDDVNIHTRTGQPLELKLSGRFQQQPYAIDLSGGQLADLLATTEPWPLQAEVRFAGTRALLNGTLEVSRQGLSVPFELQLDWPAELAKLAARLGQAPLPGRVSLLADQDRPRVSGELQLPALDAVLRFGAGAGAASDMANQSASNGEVQADRLFSVPLTVSIADVPFHGQVIVPAQDAEPGVELALSATDANASELLATLTGTTAIRGRFQQVSLQASVHGNGETDFANSLALALQVSGAELSYGNAAGELPVDITLDELTLALPAGEAVKMHARGFLLDEAFSVELTAGGLDALLKEETWPVTLTASGGGAVLDISGPLGIVPANTISRLHVGLYGERIGDLAAWLGVSPCAEGAYTLRGQLVLAEDVGRLQFIQAQTGKTRLNAELDWSGDNQIALLNAVLHFEELDPADIDVLIPLMSRSPEEGTTGRIAVDMPVLPAPVEMINADVDLTIAHIMLKLVNITDVSLSTRLREGKLQRSPFNVKIGGTRFKGYLDTEATQTTVVFEDDDADSDAGEMDTLLGKLLHWAGKTAVVPLRWIFRKTFSAEVPADC